MARDNTPPKNINIVCSNPETERRVTRLECAFVEMAKTKDQRLRAAEKTIEALVVQNNMLKDGIQALHVKLKGFEVPIMDDMCKSEETSYAEAYLDLCFPPTMSTGKNMDGTPVCGAINDYRDTRVGC